jgi:hypothetical protein
MNSTSRLPPQIRGRHLTLAFLLLLITFSVTHLLSFPGSLAHFRHATGGQKILDMRASSSAAETYERLSAMGEAGRALYLRLIVTIDIAFPLAMLAFLLVFAWFAAQRAELAVWASRLLALPPLLYFGLDLLENASVLAMLLEYPHRLDGVATIVGHLTRGKRVSMMVAFLAPVAVIAGSQTRSNTRKPLAA